MSIRYFTKGDFRTWSNNLSVKERIQLKNRAETRSPSGSTFLSHSSKDGDLLVGAIRILENNGASVYIDRIDPDMPPYTNADTAAKLKQRIAQANKFILFATSNSKESKWVPWELGIADAKKGLDSVALFPAVETENQIGWISWEYMGLYSRIIWGKIRGRDKEEWIVLNARENTAVTLPEWLRA